MTAKLHFFGAAGCVTGSCFMLETERARILVDCGLFQGPKTLKQLNYDRFPFDPGGIDAVLLTHAHIDHSGQIPKLVKHGYRGAIWATSGTVDLCAVMLPDAGAIQETEVEMLNRRNARRGEAAVEPIYTKEDAEACLSQFRATPYDVWRDVAPGVRARWWDAGHILGSASIEVELSEEGGQRVLFSGDLGPGGRDFAEDPRGPVGVDHLVLESTYGDRERLVPSSDERRKALVAELRAAHAAGGPLLIPAFAVERTQELIVDLLSVMESAEAPPGPIFLDSPLAIRASEVFLKHGGGRGGRFERLRESSWLQFTESVAESRAIERVKGWHVIVAASGMCDAGRVRHHLKRLLWREDATVLLVGYQPIGTLGRLLQDGRKVVRIQGDELKVRARVRSLDVYSGHADANGLQAWAAARRPVSGVTFLTHGEPAALGRLRASLQGTGPVIIAALDQCYRLHKQGQEALEPAEARLAPLAVSRLDWHNARAEFLSMLHAKLQAAPSDASREEIVRRLSAVLEEGSEGPAAP